MGFDIKDITDVLPFILENLSECAFIIVISIILGFFIGKQLERGKQKKRIAELNLQLSSKEEAIAKLNNEKERLEKEIEKVLNKYEILKNRAELIENRQISSNYSSLSALERLLDSKEGQLELTALIEYSYKKEIKAPVDEKTE